MDTMLAKKAPAFNGTGFEIAGIRSHFPLLDGNDKLAYLDNAATSQLPRSVTERLHRYHQFEHANVHRSVHTLGEEATKSYEQAREKIARYLNAKFTSEIIYTRGATDSINLVMQSYGRANLGKGDEIVITAVEHHSNIVPWQMLCKEKGCILRVAPINDKGEVIYDEFIALLNRKTRIVSMAHTSNAIGTINPVERMIAAAKKVGAVTLVDAAQGIPHASIDVQALGCDYLAFSGHKMYGPTGIGVLYASERMHGSMAPYLGGGDMILRVTFEETVYNEPPYKFEAGTPPIAAAVGLGEAVDFLEKVGMDAVASHEKALLEYAHEKVSRINDVRIIGTAENKSAVLSFVMGDIHPHDIGSILNSFGVAIRAGHHCAQPVMQHFGVPATARASFAMYNTFDEIDALADAIKEVRTIFA
jgi:cysteine desulfurase/selenocysteine lyase